MLFFKLGKFAAYIILVLALFRILFAIMIATGSEDLSANELASRHFLGASSSGEAIDEAIIALGVAAFLGILAEIGAQLSRIADVVAPKER